jgi:cellobiose transport system permease protein
MSTTQDAPRVTQVPGADPDPASRQRHLPSRRTRARRYAFDKKVVPYLLVSPFFILFIVFGLFPLLFNGVVAFRRWHLLRQEESGWYGFRNFTRLLSDSDFGEALVNTFGIFLLSTVPQLLIALIFANLLNRKLRAQTWWRVTALIPYVTPVVASTLIFLVVFGRDNGIANYLLGGLGIDLQPDLPAGGVDWRAGPPGWPDWARKLFPWTAIATMVNWKWIGYNAVLYLAAMQTIPRDIYEASAVDGAGPWRQLWQITIPMIRPVVIFTVVISTIGGLQLFTEAQLFDQNPQTANGGSLHEWRTIAQLIYKVGWRDLDLGYAAAMSWALFLIIVAVAIINAVVVNRLGGGRK